MTSYKSYVNFKSKGSISRLPNEVLLEIFKRLSFFDVMKHCSLVCKNWYDLSHNPILWQNIDLSAKNVSLEGLVNLISLGVVSLDLNNARVKENSPIPNDYLNDIAKSSKLRHLDMRSANIQIKTTEKLLSVCSQLEELDISDITLSKSISREIMKMTAMKKLLMKKVNRLTDFRLLQICLQCKWMQELSLADCSPSRDTLNILSKAIPLSIIRLDLSCCYELQNKHLIRISTRCWNIISLNINSCSALTPIGINMTLQNLQELQVLNLNKLYVSFKLKEINNHFKKLELFGAKGLTSQGLENIFFNWPSIEELNLRHCHLSKDTLETLCNFIPSSMKYLDLSECRELQDTHIALISTHCQVLTTLLIRSCPKLTSEVVKLIALGFPKLQELDISHTLVSPSILLSFQDVSNLRTLKIYGIGDWIFQKNLRKVLKNIEVFSG